MSEGRSKYFCSECGYESIKWLGRCPGCGSWNTFIEVPQEPSTQFGYRRFEGTTKPPQPITDIKAEDAARFKTNLIELDRVLGGGLIPGSVILVGGNPGIGKSTLLLQASSNLSRDYGSVLYVSGEESVAQTKLRAQRVGAISKKLYILSTTNVESICQYVLELKPRLIVVDSIQAVYKSDIPASPGSISQLRESTAQLMYLAKSRGVPIFIIGHVTKDGILAGPRVLEHMVDTVLYFEGDGQHSYRILRAAKNRFGSTNEVGVFEMKTDGLVPVTNPSEVLLAERSRDTPGSVVIASLEGTRPLLVELQALLIPAGFGIPQRRTTGVDYNRVSLLLAVLEKRAGLSLARQDVFINVAGGLRVNEPAADLGIALAIASCFKNRPVGFKTVVIGEVSLGGEIRAVSHIPLRINEAKKLGFKECIVPRHNLKDLFEPCGIKVVGVERIKEAIKVANIHE
jgi:DNA repair protein RadA/Sms